MTFDWLPAAKRDYQSLSAVIRTKMEKSLRLFERNPWYPSLHTEKIDDARNIWSMRIDRANRLTFQWIRGGILVRRMGQHQKTYRRP